MWIFYRSDNAISNDYLYHNIGDSVILYTQDGKVLKQEEVSSYPCVGEDRPGLRYFRSVRTTGLNENTVVRFIFSKTIKHRNKLHEDVDAGLFRCLLFYGFSTWCENRFVSPIKTNLLLLLRCGKKNLL